ncbi:hypothetical protein BpHYR1_045689 [Brachionus plicatilis]|uniref:Uncharacterized protein n=1 Tax=Brachionus plicatilis TaxID=10195 RepID=A0A3M7QGX5_BRAPC|nr:hypothetical protein BpHYR1_045689 [Brachionus plicatilis]
MKFQHNKKCSFVYLIKIINLNVGYDNVNELHSIFTILQFPYIHLNDWPKEMNFYGFMRKQCLQILKRLQ